MSRILHKNYITLEFSGLENSTFKSCLGVIGFLFVDRIGKYGSSYIPSGFIRSIEIHCKSDIIGYLIGHNYIIKEESSKVNTEYYNITGLVKNLKKDANIYRPQRRLIELRQIYLFDDDLTEFIDSHIHLLNNQNFPHYNHSYKHIKINLPPEVRINYDPIFLETIDGWGDSVRKDYNISEFGYDNNRWVGEHHNLFVQNKELLKFTSLNDPIEIGFKHSLPVILADQLFKTMGENDYSNFYKKDRFKRALFRFEIDYDIFDEIFYQQFYTAIFGWDNISEFEIRFPIAHKLLKRIKYGGLGLELPYIGFTKNIKTPISKKDVRLHIEETHPAMKGQSYYRIVSLVCMMRQVKIMREVWRRLKICEFPFIPLEESVVVEKIHEPVVIWVFEDILRHNIDKKFKTVVGKNSNFDFVPLPKLPVVKKKEEKYLKTEDGFLKTESGLFPTYTLKYPQLIHLVGKNASGKSTFVKKILTQLKINIKLYSFTTKNAVYINETYTAIYIGSMTQIEYNNGSVDDFFNLLSYALELTKIYNIKFILFNQGQILFSVKTSVRIHQLGFNYVIYYLHISEQLHYERIMIRSTHKDKIRSRDFASKQEKSFKNFRSNISEKRIPIETIDETNYNKIMSEIIKFGEMKQISLL